MNCTANYGINNRTMNNNITFKANIVKGLQEELVKELKPEFGPKYLSRLNRRLERIPEDVTIQDVFNKDGASYVRLNKNCDSKVVQVDSEPGNKLDIVEGLLHKDRHGTTRLSEYAFRLFG